MQKQLSYDDRRLQTLELLDDLALLIKILLWCVFVPSFSLWLVLNQLLFIYTVGFLPHPILSGAGIFLCVIVLIGAKLDREYVKLLLAKGSDKNQ